MPSIQNIVGNETEKQVAELFHKNEYWAFVIPKKIGGQPFDIIASREKDTWFVDAKHLEASKASFPFDRIELYLDKDWLGMWMVPGGDDGCAGDS